MPCNTTLRYSALDTELNWIVQKRRLTSITSNTIPYYTILYRPVQHNTIQSTEYISSHRTAPHRTTADRSTYHSTPRSAASSLNIHLLTPTSTLAPAPTPILTPAPAPAVGLGLLLTPVIRTSCSLHDGTRSILSSSFSLIHLLSSIPYHATPCCTIPLLAVHSYGSILLYWTWPDLTSPNLTWPNLT